MSDGIKLDTTRFESALKRLGAVTSKDIADEVKSQFKGIIVEAYRITPPAQGGGRTGRAAGLHAQDKIGRDLRSVFAPVTIKGTRTINHLFGDTSPDVGRQPPYQVTTVEIHPDVEAIYKRRKERGAARGRKVISRGQKAAYYVSAVKLEALASKLKKRVGWLAAGFNAAAERLKAPIPPYAKTHQKGAGGIDINESDRGIRIVMTNKVSYASNVPDIQRRLQRAVNTQARKIERQLPYIIAKAVKTIPELKAS
jgi:hypothetical protein